MSYPPPPSYPPSSAPLTRPLYPFLGSRAHLSLSWLSHPFLSLLLLLITLSFLLASLPALVTDAKDAIGAACQGVEGAAGVAINLPRYAAEGVNELNVRMVTSVIDGAGTVADLLLLAVEKVIIFLIDIYRSLFLCLLDLAVHGSITVLVAGIEEAQQFIEDVLGDVRTAIQASVETINEGLNSTLGLIDDIPGVNFDIPQISIPELSSLENVTLPDTLVTSLESLNSSIPTYTELKATLDSLISTPIDALRTAVNTSFTNATASFNVEMLPVPAAQTIEVCQELDTSWIDDVGTDLGKFVKLFIGVTVLAMVVLVAVCAVWERCRYRLFLVGVSEAREAWLANLLSSSSVATSSSPHATAPDPTQVLSTPNLLSFLSTSSHPSLSRQARRLTSLLRLRLPSSRANLIWFLSYIIHPTALAFLGFGLLGLLVVQVQLAVLEGPVKASVGKRAGEGASEFGGSVVSALEGKWEEISEEWAEESNRVIGGFEGTVNDDVSGWVDNTTMAINTTINAFYDGITDELTSVFNGTILEDPILDLVYCLLGSKIDSLSSALTYLHSHLSLSLPSISPSFLLPSNTTTASLTSALSNPNSTYSAPSVAAKMVERYADNLRQQRLLFFLAVGLWGVVVLMGAVGVWWKTREARRPLTQAERDEKEAVDAAKSDEKGMFSSFSFQAGARGGAGAGAAGAARLEPLHLRTASSRFSPSRRHRRGDEQEAVEEVEEPPSPAYALFPRPGETTSALPPPSFPPFPPSHSPASFPSPSQTSLIARAVVDGEGADEGARAGVVPASQRSWASLVDFFQPSAFTPAPAPSSPPSDFPTSSAPSPSPSTSSARLQALKSKISLPRPSSSLRREGFAPSSFPKTRKKVLGKARELRRSVEERREERRRRTRESGKGDAIGGWVALGDEEEDKRDVGGLRVPPASPPPTGPLPLPPTAVVSGHPFASSSAASNPFADTNVLSTSSPRNPFRDSPSVAPLSSPSTRPPAASNPFSDPLIAPSFTSLAPPPPLPSTPPRPRPSSNPFLDHLLHSSSPFSYIPTPYSTARTPVHPFAAVTIEGEGEGMGAGGRVPFGDEATEATGRERGRALQSYTE